MRKRKKGGSIFIFVIIGVILVGVLVYFLFFSSFFKIQNIFLVSNTEDYDKFNTFFQTYINRNILFFNKNEFVGNLKDKFPIVDNVDIKKKFPNSLDIKIEYRKPKYYVCSEECFLMDKKGFVFQKVDKSFNFDELVELENGFNNIKVGKYIASESDFNKIDFILNNLAGNNIKVLSVDLKNETVYFNTEDFSIIFALVEDVNWQLEKFFTALKKIKDTEDMNKLEYIDVRFGDRVYYK